MSNLHVIRETNLQDVVATLREIANHLEKLPAVEKPEAMVLVVELPWELSIFTAGTSDASHAHLLLSAGAAKMMKAVLDGKN